MITMIMGCTLASLVYSHELCTMGAYKTKECTSREAVLSEATSCWGMTRKRRV